VGRRRSGAVPPLPPTLAGVDASTALVVGGAVGLLIGAGGALPFRFRVRRGQPPAPEAAPRPVVADGAARVLSVLRSASVVLDGDERIVRSSPTANALGVVRDGRLTHAGLARLVRLVRSDGEIRDLNIELPRRRGTNVTLTARVAPLGPDLVVVLVDDNTDARRVDDVRRDFVANVSHELKTPVAALSLLAESVQSCADDPEAVARFAGRMTKEATRLATLVVELIDLSRVQGDDPLSHAEPLRVEDLVRDATDRNRTGAAAATIELVSASEQGLLVYGDREQLATALTNLIANALQYSPPRTRVAIAARSAGDSVEVSVTDQGIGIPDADLDRIFERFYRVDPARSRATGGTGLGLSIVKHVVSNHGGEIAVWSLEGAGSTFTLRLPRHQTHLAMHPDDPISPAVAAVAKVSSRKVAQ
jgi:two-component system, OmpR family, sensor histidine kinase SenX3